MKNKFIFSFLFFLFFLVLLIFYAAAPAQHLPSFGLLKFHDIKSLEPNSKSLRLVTYNIGYASGKKNNEGAILTREEVIENLDNIIIALKKFSPDVLAMQEVDFKAKRTFDINELDYLAHGLEMPFAAYAITWNKNYMPWPYWPPKNQFGKIVSGQAILSRYPLSDYDVHVFKKPDENAFWYNLFYLDRVTQKVSVNLGKKNIVVWNVHLEAFHEGTRLNQASLLAQRAVSNSDANASFILGDFNSTSTIRSNLSESEKKSINESPAALQYTIDNTPFKNAEDSKNHFFTMPSWDSLRKIDHILYLGNVKMLSVQTLPTLQASDHLPVLTEFNLP
jgi:endonuclease/exonuclease/phosphatase family metal-dependent hydrolase